jgi:hypothetical protein
VRRGKRADRRRQEATGSVRMSATAFYNLNGSSHFVLDRIALSIGQPVADGSVEKLISCRTGI